MPKISKSLLFLFLGFLGLAQSPPAKKTSVAVYPIKAVGGVDKSLAQTMGSLLGYELSQSPKLIYIREDMLKEVMKRQAQNISDACDSTMCQVEIGKLVQAQKMVVGDLSKLGSLYILTVNLIDVETGAVENTFKERCACKEDELEQLASAAGNKIREHFGETGLTEPSPPPSPEPDSGRIKQPPPSGKGYGSLAIATEPPGAEIYLDAEFKGKTPATLTGIPAGSHSLSLMKKGYSPLMKEVVVTANQTFRVSERLLKQTGSLDITTTPTGAQIFVDDKYAGVSPKKLEGVLAGPHTVKAQAENYQPAEKQVEVGHQQTEAVAIELAGLPGKILVTSIPEGAEVKIDGEKKGVTTYTGALSPGKHRVELNKEGYESAGEEVEIQPNKAVSKSYTLKKYSGPRAGEVTRAPGQKAGGPMVLVPAGEFWMGCNEQVDNQCEADEKPYHQVYLDAFYIDQYEVTNGEYLECFQAGACRPPEYNDSSSDYRFGGKEGKFYRGFEAARQPAVGVSWEDARSYCGWAGKRLPTEAEWEKAARGTDGRKYPWGNQLPTCSLANFADCPEDKTWTVGSKPAGASPYGALDMAGNVWEWVADWYGENYYLSSPGQNPPGAGSGTLRVLRGGSWNHYAELERASNRVRVVPDYRSGHHGFRCAR